MNFESGVVTSHQGNTYIASSIYAAKAALTNEISLYPQSTNYIIILSDGDSYADGAPGAGDNQMVATSGGSIRDTGLPAPGQWPTFTGTVSTSASGISSLTNNGTYPDYKDQCQQAVQAGIDATAAGITVISVANGANASGGCSKDSPSITACNTMKGIASNGNSFYSTTSSGCTDPLAGTTHKGASTLQTIFQNVAFGLVRATLIPNGTT